MSDGILKSESLQLLPFLPYAENALEPVISAKTISFHKNRNAYVTHI